MFGKAEWAFWGGQSESGKARCPPLLRGWPLRPALPTPAPSGPHVPFQTLLQFQQGWPRNDHYLRREH